MALHNATDGSDAGLDLFDKFSRRSSEYDRKGLEMQWESFANKPPGRRLLTAGTIFYLAQQNGWRFPPKDQPVPQGAPISPLLANLYMRSAGEPPHDEDATEEEPRADGQQGRGESPRPEGPPPHCRRHNRRGRPHRAAEDNPP
jgi:hypothetical protein